MPCLQDHIVYDEQRKSDLITTSGIAFGPGHGGMLKRTAMKRRFKMITYDIVVHRDMSLEKAVSWVRLSARLLHDSQPDWG